MEKLTKLQFGVGVKVGTKVDVEVDVGVDVPVMVEVLVEVKVGVGVGVFVGVLMLTGVLVGRGVLVGVAVREGFLVGVGVGDFRGNPKRGSRWLADAGALRSESTGEEGILEFFVQPDTIPMINAAKKIVP